MVNSFKTFLKHSAKDFYNQSVNPPVVRASTIIFKSMQDIKKTQNKYLKDPVSGNFDYGRQGTSTTYALQQILRKIEWIVKAMADAIPKYNIFFLFLWLKSKNSIICLL